MTRTNQQCHTHDSILSFLRGQLTSNDEEALQLHLDECVACRKLLSSSAADEAAWTEAQQFFGSDAMHEDLLKSIDSSDGEIEEPESIESLLKLLGPTDDPRMLGRIGSYEIVGVLGRGGMGIVFKAYEPSLNRYVAIKLLLPHLAASGAARMRFAREGRAAAAVIDDNVLPIFSVAEWQGTPYLVTQLSRGNNLQKRINDSGPLELREILRLGMQTASGLAAAHAQGLVHRDVKPLNILLDGTVDRALLTDFGLARAVDDASITCSGIIAGTPQYMSPEQARGGIVDARSDLFGLGSVLYTMCTGRPPFRAENSFVVLRLITDVHPREIREVNPDIPEWLCVIVEKLMAKSPEDRYQSAAEVAELLSACLAHVQQPTVVGLPSELRETLERNRFAKSSWNTWRRTMAHYITYRMPYWLPCFMSTLIAFAVSIGPAMTLPTLPKETFLHSIPPATAVLIVTTIGFLWGLAITLSAKRVANETDAAEKPQKLTPLLLFIIGGAVVVFAVVIPWFIRQSRLADELANSRKQSLATAARDQTESSGLPGFPLSTNSIETSSFEVRRVGDWSDATRELASTVSASPDAVPTVELIRWGDARNGLQAGLLIPKSVTHGEQIEARLVLRKIAGDEPEQLILNGRHVQLVMHEEDRIHPSILDPLLVPLNPQVVVTLRAGEHVEFPNRRIQFGGSLIPDIRRAMFVGSDPGIVRVKFVMIQPDGPPLETGEFEVRVNEVQPSANTTADASLKSGSQKNESAEIGPDKHQAINDLQLEARKALQKSHESLQWMLKFDMLVTHRYSQPELGKVVVKERIRRDAPRMVASSTHIFEEKPNFAGNLTNWSMDDGEMFISRSTSIGQKKLTGGVTVKRRNQEHWKMLEASGSFAMEGHAWGNAGKTITALLLEAKHLDVRLEKVNDQECLRISDRSEWGDMTVWIEASPLRRLRKWESRKERGNRYADSRVGEEKNTSNLESFEQLVDNIEYDTIEGRDFAVRCRVCNRINPNGGKTQEEYLSLFERTEVNLQPDFSTDNPFIADFDPGARITDWDSHDRDAAFYWRDNKLTK